MRVDLIRHGETPGNCEKRYVGKTDESLTQDARRQAADLHLEMPELLFVSPMKRCIETAAILFPGMDPIILPDLRECDFGDYEYKNWKELTGEAEYQAYIDSGGKTAFPNGEPRELFVRRCVSGFYQAERIAIEHEADHFAIVAHGGTIMAVLSDIGRPKRDYFEWQVRNLGGYTAEYAGGYLRCPRKYGKLK